jgi:hypothetical protein
VISRTSAQYLTARRVELINHICTRRPLHLDNQMSLKYTSITRETFNALLARYSSVCPPSPAFSALDTLRYETIPNALRARNDALPVTGKGAGLTQEEVMQLVEWKLYVESSLKGERVM